MSFPSPLAERRDDWRARLSAFIADRRDDPFAWGSRDCCLFAADAVEAMTGADFAVRFRGYSTKFGALRALRRAGFQRVFDAADATWPLGSRARTGDVVGQPAWPLDALMIAHSPSQAWGQGEAGLILAPIPANAIIWSV